MGQSTTRHCIHLSGSSDAALAGERPFKLQKNMKRPDPCCHYMVLKHPLQTALLFPSKKPGLPLLEIFSPRQKQTLSKRGPQLSTWQYRQNSWRLWRQKWPAEAEAMRFENLATADSLGQKRSGNCTLRASLTQGTGCFQLLQCATQWSLTSHCRSRQCQNRWRWAVESQCISECSRAKGSKPSGNGAVLRSLPSLKKQGGSANRQTMI